MQVFFEMFETGIAVGRITGVQQALQNGIFNRKKFVHIQLRLTDLEKVGLYCILTYTEAACYRLDCVALPVQPYHLFYLTHGSGFSGHWVISFPKINQNQNPKGAIYSGIGRYVQTFMGSASSGIRLNFSDRSSQGVNMSRNQTENRTLRGQYLPECHALATLNRTLHP